MSINDGEAGEYFNSKQKGMSQLARIVTCAVAVLVLVAFFEWRSFFTNISHKAELFQGILVCSTALMALSGLMIIEIKKTKVSGLSSQNPFKKVDTMNTLASLGGALVFLQWVLLLSLVCITLSIVQLSNNNSFVTAFAFAAFLEQIYVFVLALLLQDLLPS